MVFDMEWMYDIYILEIWHVFSIIFSVAFMYHIYLNARKSKLLVNYLILHGILLIWMICKVFKTIAPSVELKWMFIVMQYGAICFLGSTFLIFSYLYARGRHLPVLTRLVVNLPPLFVLIIILTNSKHHLFYTTYDFLGDTFGPVFYVYITITYLYLVTGICFCASCFGKQFHIKRVQARLFSFAILLPLVVNVLYVAGFIEPRFDLTPIICNFSLVVFAIAIFRYRFLNLLPYATHKILEGMPEGVIIVNREGNPIYCNRAFSDLTDYEMGSDTDFRDIERLLEDELFDCMESINTKPLYIRGKIKGYVYIIVDLSEKLNFIKQLENKKAELLRTNREIKKYSDDVRGLAIIEERNRAAREMHDILGHSFTLVLSLLESSLVILKNDYKGAILKIKQAINIVETGLKDFEGTMKLQKNSERTASFQIKRELEQIIDKYRLSGINICLTVKGHTGADIPYEAGYTLCRICQEALTNSLRHGKAENTDIILKLNQNETHLYIIDDGRGCAAVKEGNGIMGMKDRIHGLNGKILYGSTEGGGFTMHVSLPQHTF